VKNAILSADDIDATDLNVDTDDKIVHLRGSVNSESAKKRAESLAKNIVGTKYTVKNELKVTGK
jgi:osmotically-inducible protein OsmY